MQWEEEKLEVTVASPQSNPSQNLTFKEFLDIFDQFSTSHDKFLDQDGGLRLEKQNSK